MDELVKRLAEAREKLLDANAEREALEDEINALFAKRVDDANAAVKAAKYAVEDARSAVVIAALEAFAETGSKQPHPAVTVGEYTVVGYEPADAHAYCVANLPTALKLDKRKFEAVAKVAELDFVAITKEARARIASDLSAYLETTDEQPF